MFGLAKELQSQVNKKSSLFGKNNELLFHASRAFLIFSTDDSPPPFNALAMASEPDLLIL